MELKERMDWHFSLAFFFFWHVHLHLHFGVVLLFILGGSTHIQVLSSQLAILAADTQIALLTS
jgi:hypothetical protein